MECGSAMGHMAVPGSGFRQRPDGRGEGRSSGGNLARRTRRSPPAQRHALRDSSTRGRQRASHSSFSSRQMSFGEHVGWRFSNALHATSSSTHLARHTDEIGGRLMFGGRLWGADVPAATAGADQPRRASRKNSAAPCPPALIRCALSTHRDGIVAVALHGRRYANGPLPSIRQEFHEVWQFSPVQALPRRCTPAHLRDSSGASRYKQCRHCRIQSGSRPASRLGRGILWPLSNPESGPMSFLSCR